MKKGFVPIGNIFVPLGRGGLASSDDGNESRKERKRRMKEQEERDWKQRAIVYVEERKKVLPIIDGFVNKLLEQNKNLEVHLRQLIEVLQVLKRYNTCNEYITMDVSHPYKNDKVYFITALDSTQPNSGRINTPLFKVTLELDEYGNIVNFQLRGAKVINDNSYSFKREDGIYLTIMSANEDVAQVTYYTADVMTYGDNPKYMLESYEVSRNKANKR